MSSSLRTLGTGLVLIAFAAGLLSMWIWMQSVNAWRAHLARAFSAGVVLHGDLLRGPVLDNAISIRPLSTRDQRHADAGEFRQLSGAPKPVFVTNVPITTGSENPLDSKRIDFLVLSADLVYPLANLPPQTGNTAHAATGDLARLLASYCSDPLVLAQIDEAQWVQINGTAIWGCSAAPSDRRVLAALIALIALAILVTSALNISSAFTNFAERLRSRRALGGPESYEADGPRELQKIVDALNTYLEVERSQLQERAAVLSGVSHDLGAPATRLRLRAALIEDSELRERLEAEIDKMTGIVESVLTYTHAEMNAEPPRKLSLNSLIEAIVADYQDMERPVTFRQSEDVVVRGASSVFMSRQGKGFVSGDRQIIITGRPVALQRAITNLVDNALKYGRRATVGLDADADNATITVDDEGASTSAEELEKLMAPFQRGSNVTSISGFGLGLTIVSAIAKLHGGTLSFEDSPGGLRACLRIVRRA